MRCCILEFEVRERTETFRSTSFIPRHAANNLSGNQYNIRMRIKVTASRIGSMTERRFMTRGLVATLLWLDYESISDSGLSTSLWRVAWRTMAPIAGLANRSRSRRCHFLLV
jgi:hypothetical protein